MNKIITSHIWSTHALTLSLDVWYITFSLEIKLECSTEFIFKLKILLGDENERGGGNSGVKPTVLTLWGGTDGCGHWPWLSGPSHPQRTPNPYQHHGHSHYRAAGTYSNAPLDDQKTQLAHKLWASQYQPLQMFLLGLGKKNQLNVFNSLGFRTSFNVN